MSTKRVGPLAAVNVLKMTDAQHHQERNESEYWMVDGSMHRVIRVFQ